jgi:hypothetical protein
VLCLLEERGDMRPHPRRIRPLDDARAPVGPALWATHDATGGTLERRDRCRDRSGDPARDDGPFREGIDQIDRTQATAAVADEVRGHEGRRARDAKRTDDGRPVAPREQAGADRDAEAAHGPDEPVVVLRARHALERPHRDDRPCPEPDQGHALPDSHHPKAAHDQARLRRRMPVSDVIDPPTMAPDLHPASARGPCPSIAMAASTPRGRTGSSP